jgi:hypothetical protein
MTAQWNPTHRKMRDEWGTRHPQLFQLVQKTARRYTSPLILPR